jgi:hypothetical protein
MDGMVLMDTDIEHKMYLINSKIKALNGKKNMISDGEYVEETLEDIEAQIQALTNLLEMI